MDGPVPEPSDPSVTNQEPGTPAARLTQFQNQLAAKSPIATLTLAIIGINFAIYLGMLLTGVHFLNPDIPSLLKWGANLGSVTTSGQWWRLFTCTFLHIGLIHILFNMYVLWDIGRFLERLIGSPGFAVVYVLSGLSGSVASIWWNPHIVSAGASGAIFGLYGCLIGYLLAGSQDIPAEVAKKLRTNALMFIGFNLIWGLTHRGIDMAGHLGGLLGGLACGFAMAKGLQSGGISARPRINLRVLAVGLLIVALAAASRPKVVDFQQEIARFSETETKVQASYNQALQKARSGSLANSDFANLVDAEVIGPWHSARLRLQGLHGLPEAQTRLLSRIEHYAETRERAWVVFSEALRQQDAQKFQQANGLHREAEGQLKDLSK